MSEQVHPDLERERAKQRADGGILIDPHASPPPRHVEHHTGVYKGPAPFVNKDIYKDSWTADCSCGWVCSGILLENSAGRDPEVVAHEQCEEHVRAAEGQRERETPTV